MDKEEKELIEGLTKAIEGVTERLGSVCTQLQFISKVLQQKKE